MILGNHKVLKLGNKLIQIVGTVGKRYIKCSNNCVRSINPLISEERRHGEPLNGDLGAMVESGR